MLKFFKKYFSLSPKSELNSSESTITVSSKTVESYDHSPVYRLNKNMKVVSGFNGNNEEFSKIIELADEIEPPLAPEKSKNRGSRNLPSRETKPLKKLNLCTDFIDYAKRADPNGNHSILRNPDPSHVVNLQQYIDHLTKAVKFILPNDAVIFEGGIKKGSWKDRYGPYINHYRLPYESIALEMEYSLKVKVFTTPENDKHFIDDTFFPLIFLCDQKDDHITINVFYRETTKEWKLVNRSPIILLNDFSSPFMRSANEYLGDETASDFLSNLSQLAAHAVLDLITLINCSNVEITEELSGGKFINEKRVKKGKTPLFDYKVLTLDFASSASNDSVGVSGSMKRSHLRRGHIRRLKDRTIWVNACAVNGGAKGEVKKDYKLTKMVI